LEPHGMDVVGAGVVVGELMEVGGGVDNVVGAGVVVELLVVCAEVVELDVVGTEVVVVVEQLGYARSTLKQYLMLAMVLPVYLTFRVPSS